jgi:N utilization substance protein A
VRAEKEVVESVENALTEVTLDDARQVDPEADFGSVIMVDSTPKDFGRVAAQTAKQVILQRLREAERDAQYDEFSDREGDMVHGTVHSITPQAVTIGLGRAEAILPRNQQIPGERFHVRERVRVYVLEVRKSTRGPVIVVSRSHPYMLRRLLEMEVPEISQGLVEIKGIAREAGKRAKVAVAALREGVDPVGACVGLRGVRIQSIVRDLNDEKIDVIEWNPDPATFIAKALSPARVSGVFLDEDPDRGKTASVIVPEDQLSLAIGRSGVNARLSARLTGWRIDIKSLPEAAADSLRRLESDPLLADLAQELAESVEDVEAILLKKAENRPVTPEEYQDLTVFVDRVQGAVAAERAAKRREKREKILQIRAAIPKSAFETPLEEVELSTRVLNLLTDANYQFAGQVMEQLEVDADQILGIQGFGTKSMDELETTLEEYPFPEVEEEPEVEEVEEPVMVTEEEVEVEEAPEVEEEIPEAELIEEAEAVEEIEEAEVEPEEEEALEPIEVVEEEEPEVEPEDEIEKAFETFAEQLGIDLEAEVPDEDLVEEEGLETPSKKRKKRKKGIRRVEYDPEADETFIKRRRKPGRSEEDWEEYDY